MRGDYRPDLGEVPDNEEEEQWGMPHPDWPDNWEDLTFEQLRILERSGSYGQRLTARRYIDEASRKSRL